MTPKPYPTPWRWVDLGLPSGTLWLDRNVGADSPEDFGLYFMWGQLEGYKELPGYEFNSRYYNSLGLNRINADLTLENDAATYYYGKKFRIPSAEEFSELINYTTSTIVGSSMRLVSIVNGESILLPINGAMGGNEMYYTDSARCWTRKYQDQDHAYGFRGQGSSVSVVATLRYRGLAIRPVYNR